MELPITCSGMSKDEFRAYAALELQMRGFSLSDEVFEAAWEDYEIAVLERLYQL